MDDAVLAIVREVFRETSTFVSRQHTPIMVKKPRNADCLTTAVPRVVRSSHHQAVA